MENRIDKADRMKIARNGVSNPEKLSEISLLRAFITNVRKMVSVKISYIPIDTTSTAPRNHGAKDSTMITR